MYEKLGSFEKKAIDQKTFADKYAKNHIIALTGKCSISWKKEKSLQ